LLTLTGHHLLKIRGCLETPWLHQEANNQHKKNILDVIEVSTAIE